MKSAIIEEIYVMFVVQTIIFFNPKAPHAASNAVLALIVETTYFGLQKLLIFFQILKLFYP